MPDHGREIVLTYLKEEVIGPRRNGQPIDTSISNIFTEKGSAYGPWVDSKTGEEILRNLKPTDRYGAGILHPTKSDNIDAATEEEVILDEFTDEDFPEAHEEAIEVEDVDQDFSIDTDGSPDLEPREDARRPSSMGISFFADFNQSDAITVEVSGGWYSRFQVVDSTTQKKKNVDCYLRNSFKLKAILNAENFLGIDKKMHQLTILEESDSPITLSLRAYVRPWDDGNYLITLSVINETKNLSFPQESRALFQTEIELNLGSAKFLPYPKVENRSELVEAEEYREKARLDDESTDLLFSQYPTLAIGHNCSVDWQKDSKNVSTIKADCFPVYEAPSITPDIEYKDGQIVRLDMRALSNKDEKSYAIEALTKLVDEYQLWIEHEAQIFSNSENHEKFGNAFQNNLSECQLAVARMRKGLACLEEDPQVYEAFRIANQAMLNQQARSKLPLRRSGLREDGRIFVEGAHPSSEIPENVGFWRAFQIAFFLNVIESVANDDSDSRETVDLIFFPTGGGKTEAYLGVIAFTVALRRLRNSENVGTTVIMRYTLRLLTTQQFSRAASLICALEILRRDRPQDLGSTPISIGAWLGSSVTPNKQKDAVTLLTTMKSDLARRPWKKENPFLILQCPWCAASMGPVEKDLNKYKGKNSSIPGYEVSGIPRRVRFACPDSLCEFQNELPLYVVDEDLYQFQPTLVIGTVDKFALLAWKAESRSLFGISDEGIQENTPPELIIQDEFHLISGPLGSMVGLYETVIEHLTSKIINGRVIKPKIISSTATIRRFWAQANAVYGRVDVSLFPPPLRDVSDSFFAVWSRDKQTGELSQGRKYVGIYMPGTGSIRSSEVRVGSALAQAPMLLEENLRDPWWTNLWFFNDLKQLGTAISLFHNDIAKYMPGLVRRDAMEKRVLKSPEELTSRRQNSEIPKVLQQLATSYVPGMHESKQRAWDTCLASNIIEVGIDVDRLSLMTVVGQPKSTAQYIQVTGRVGRKWFERPGLVVTLFAMGRARDLSHFEHFRSYHEKLYSQVEPTSVTPFSIPVVQRALRGAVAALIRTTLPSNKRPREITKDEFARISDVFRSRFDSIQGTSKEELQYLEDTLQTIQSELSKWLRDEWEGENGLLRRQVSDGKPERLTWMIPSSMRNVDASASLKITDLYFGELIQDSFEGDHE